MGWFIGGVIVVVAWLTAIVGWVANIVQLVSMASGPVTTLFVLKAIGIFAAPLGSILGLIGLF